MAALPSTARRVAPAFQRMRQRQVPLAQPRGFVDVQPDMDAVRHARQIFSANFERPPGSHRPDCSRSRPAYRRHPRPCRRPERPAAAAHRCRRRESVRCTRPSHRRFSSCRVDRPAPAPASCGSSCGPMASSERPAWAAQSHRRRGRPTPAPAAQLRRVASRATANSAPMRLRQRRQAATRRRAAASMRPCPSGSARFPPHADGCGPDPAPLRRGAAPRPRRAAT